MDQGLVCSLIWPILQLDLWPKASMYSLIGPGMAYLAVTVSDTDLAATLLEKKKNPLETTRHHQREFAALPRASRSRAAAAMPSPRRAVNLRWSSLETEVEAAIAVEGGCGVDLAMVGRALGLDPATVRLNGYFVSRGRGHVSSAVTWRALLDFFAARGLPTGDAPAAPVAVHGKPAPPPPPPPVSGMRARFSTNRWFSNFDSCHYYCYEIERTIWLEVCELAGFVASIHVFA